MELEPCAFSFLEGELQESSLFLTVQNHLFEGRKPLEQRFELVLVEIHAAVVRDVRISARGESFQLVDAGVSLPCRLEVAGQQSEGLVRPLLKQGNAQLALGRIESLFQRSKMLLQTKQNVAVVCNGLHRLKEGTCCSILFGEYFVDHNFVSETRRLKKKEKRGFRALISHKLETI